MMHLIRRCERGTGELETLGTALRSLALARDPVTLAVGGWGPG
jgi:hypothetical protein